MRPPQQQKVEDAATWSVEKVNDWGASLERQLKDVGNVLEQKLQKVDGGVLGQLDDSMLEKLGLQLVRFLKMVEAARAKKGSKPVVSPPTPEKAPATKTQAQTQGPRDTSSISNSSSSSEQTPVKVEAQIDEAEECDLMYENAKLKVALGKKKAEETKPAEEAALPSKQGPTTSASKKLLVIEVFAGSHPVGRHFQHLQSQQEPDAYSVAAYAAIEAQQPNGEKFKAPEPHTLGITPAHHLSLHARVEHTDAQTKLLDFVRRELQGFGLHGVVVFGGPPCTKYSNADKQFRLRQENLFQTELAHDGAERQLDRLLQSQADGDAVPAVKLARARRLLVSTKAAYEAAADAVMKDELEVQAADAVVSSFLQLFKDIQQECKAAGDVPCHLVMENPYSSADRALWNRPFMKESHLLNLPDTKKGSEVAKQEGFQPSKSAWLNTEWQNWCTYGPGYPQKDTIVFTTLARKSLPDRHCKAHCKCPIKKQTGEHGTKVKKMGRGDRAFESAQWPTEFVGAVLRACVGSQPYVGL